MTAPAWRDIASAPRDGTEVLVYRKYPTGYELMTVARYFAGKDNWEEGVGLYDIEPSHWMPLPDPPASPSKLTKEWCMRMAAIEGDDEVGAGLLARDPEIEDESPS